jgi:hypothetical protein
MRETLSIRIEAIATDAALKLNTFRNLYGSYFVSNDFRSWLAFRFTPIFGSSERAWS